MLLNVGQRAKLQGGPQKGLQMAPRGQPPASTAAKREEVNKHYQRAKVLAGFMDENHFRGFAQEHLMTLTASKQTALLKKAEEARTAASSLSSNVDFAAEVRPIDPAACEKFAKDKLFVGAFGNTSHRFAWIRPTSLVALQVFVNAQEEQIPSEESALIEFSLPHKWNVPAEISFIPPMGPIYIVSSSPHLSGLAIRMEPKKGQIIIEPPSHINMVQVMRFNGRYYLRNGYHRVVGALAAGVTELPALIVEGSQPAEVELANMGLAGFGVVYSMNLARPALVADFIGDAVVEILMREKRYGASVSLQISPVNIGV
jgi:hypothetical protein